MQTHSHIISSIPCSHQLRSLLSCFLCSSPHTQEFFCFSDWDHLPKKHYDYKQVCLVYPHNYGYGSSDSSDYTYDYDKKVGFLSSMGSCAT